MSLVGLEVPIAGEVGSAWAEAPRAFVSVGVWAGRAPGRPGSGAGAPRNGEARKAALFRPENVRVFQKRAGRPGGGPEQRLGVTRGPWCPGASSGPGPGSGRKRGGHGSFRSLAAGGLGSGCFSF